MKLGHIVAGVALFSIGSCYGKPAYTAIRNWYQEKREQPDTAAMSRTLQTLRENPAVLDSYIKRLTPAERQGIIMRSSQMQIEYFLRTKTNP